MSEQLKIMVGCNILTSIQGLAYVNHCQNWFNWGKQFPDYKFYSYMPRRASIDRMRNETAKRAMELECDYLYFYDDDCIVPIDALKKLLSHKVGVVAGLTFIRGYPFDPMVFNFAREDDDGNGILESDPEILKATDLTICNAVGFSCVLIDVKIIKQLKPPFFITGSYTTEDIYFCIRVQKEQGVSIYCDPTIEVSHVVDQYWVNKSNREIVRRLEIELSDIDSEERISPIDRGEEYMQQCLERVKEIA